MGDLAMELRRVGGGVAATVEEGGGRGGDPSLSVELVDEGRS